MNLGHTGPAVRPALEPPMLNDSPSARAESAKLNSTMFFEPMEAIQMWLPVVSAALDYHGKIFEIFATLNRQWLEIYTDFLQEPLTDYRSEKA
jgi:hypothetical protein